MIKKTKKKTVTQLAAAAAAAQPVESKPAFLQPSPSATREVTFAIYEPRAEQVLLCGAFNDWAPTPLTKKENRDWKTTLALAPGRYEYKFVIDGKWKPDPRAAESVSNGLGTLNSVIEVKA